MTIDARAQYHLDGRRPAGSPRSDRQVVAGPPARPWTRYVGGCPQMSSIEFASMILYAATVLGLSFSVLLALV